MVMSVSCSSPVGKPKARTFQHLSFSAIATFQACPLKFFFKYVLGLPEETVSASLVFGSAIHAALQFHFEQLLARNHAPDLDALLDIYQEAWREHTGKEIKFPRGDTIDSFGRVADRILTAFTKSEFARPNGAILGVEEPLRGEIVPGCPELLARVDLITETAEHLELTDFKTARASWNENCVSDAAPQLLLYSELAKPLADGKPVRLRFAVMSKTKIPELRFHDVELDAKRLTRTKRIVERVWRAIQSGHFYPNPSPINCPTCPFQKPCRAWTG
jgi:RecB family exonuclease